MITCPWCGTSYTAFQPACSKCGGPLPAQAQQAPADSETLPIPPAAPRPIAGSYAWRLLGSDGFSIASFVFVLIGAIFSLTGFGLTLGIITAFVGVPFLMLGIGFLIVGGSIFTWRYQKAQKVVLVLREGISTVGQITDLSQNFSVTVNGRNPWIINYAYRVIGQEYKGELTTLNQPGPQIQPGKAVRILYLLGEPQQSSIYPHP